MFGHRKRFLYAVLIATGLFSTATFVGHAYLRDSDVDGITDEAEINVYFTDLKNHDTDKDGFDDGYEIVNKSNPLDAGSNPFMVSGQEGDISTRRIFTVRHIVWTAAIFVSVMGCLSLMALWRKRIR